MKKITLLFLLSVVTTFSYAQFSQDFEAAPSVNDYLIDNNGPAATPKMIGSWEPNPVTTGINTSANCVRDLEEVGAKPWAYPIFQFGSGGITLNAVDGKFLKLKVLSTNKTDFTINIRPWVGGSDTNPQAQTFSGVTLNEWFEVEFDLSGEPDGYIGRFDFFFDKNGGTYYIDDLTQSTSATLSTTKFNTSSINMYPNPVKDVIYFGKDVKTESYKVLNVTGALIKEVKATQRSLDVSELTAGMYFVATDSGVSKFIKQ
ncbi:T9SS type A sorting domain-containing protein [Algibacter sp. 2305UL17-15]|uniref:T9SS type A sorting domain-containing protein n=1 Tax=Algibacter sp. 2305UL17-15 TaxID=3231268 RepID=UPI00345A40EB